MEVPRLGDVKAQQDILAQAGAQMAEKGGQRGAICIVSCIRLYQVSTIVSTL